MLPKLKMFPTKSQIPPFPPFPPQKRCLFSHGHCRPPQNPIHEIWPWAGKPPGRWIFPIEEEFPTAMCGPLINSAPEALGVLGRLEHHRKLRLTKSAPRQGLMEFGLGAGSGRNSGGPRMNYTLYSSSHEWVESTGRRVYRDQDCESSATSATPWHTKGAAHRNVPGPPTPNGQMPLVGFAAAEPIAKHRVLGSKRLDSLQLPHTKHHVSPFFRGTSTMMIFSFSVSLCHQPQGQEQTSPK